MTDTPADQPVAVTVEVPVSGADAPIVVTVTLTAHRAGLPMPPDDGPEPDLRVPPPPSAVMGGGRIAGIRRPD